jgi:hypothetical protein
VSFLFTIGRGRSRKGIAMEMILIRHRDKAKDILNYRLVKAIVKRWRPLLFTIENVFCR